jgi:transcriptional regulator ATRX
MTYTDVDKGWLAWLCLQVITFAHTMLYNDDITNLRTCLVVCPLNTVLNWQNEWTKWFDEKQQLDVSTIAVTLYT